VLEVVKFMKIYALSSLLEMPEHELSQVSSIKAPTFYLEFQPKKKIARLKEAVLNFVFKRKSKYQIICAKLAQLSNLQEFAFYLESLKVLTDSEFIDFNNAVAQYNNLHTIALIVNSGNNNAKIRKRLLPLGETLAQLPKLQTIELIYIASRTATAYQLWQDLWKIISQCKNVQNINFCCDYLKELTIAQWQIVGSMLAQCENLKCVYFKTKDLHKLNDGQLQALGEAFAQAQTLQSINLAVNIGRSKPAQRLILGIALAKLPNLQNLDLSANNIFCDLLDVDEWQEVGGALSKLQSLQI
jgi:hypothetical protein